VEEPNAAIFLKPVITSETAITSPVPVIDRARCKGHGRCQEVCKYNAVKIFNGKPFLFEHLCHSCGGCVLACPNDAVHERPERIGILSISNPLPGLKLVTGTLDTDDPHAVPVIRAAKQAADHDPVVIIDTAPGTSCPVVEAMDGSDACILVTESTPFGLHDLELAVDVAGRLGIPIGIVINRSDGKDEETLRFCADHHLDVLLTIPFSREIAAIQSRGGLLCRERPGWQGLFADLFRKSQSLAGVDP